MKAEKERAYAWPSKTDQGGEYSFFTYGMWENNKGVVPKGELEYEF